MTNIAAATKPMQHKRLYIIQLVGILLLLCGYFLRDQPDCLSMMHFDPAAPSTISNISKQGNQPAVSTTTVSSHNNSSRKTSIPKYFSLEIIMPLQSRMIIHTYSNVTYAYPLPEYYRYLHYQEINPPPPWRC